MKSTSNKLVEIFDDCGGGVLGCLVATICIILAVGIFFGVLCLEGWVLMLLWNWLAVELFGAPILGYWLCVGIMFAVWFIRRTLFGTNCQSRNRR